MMDMESDEEESNFIQFARKELELAGLFDSDSDYGGMLGTAVMDLAKVFSRQGHSGFSAQVVARLFYDLTKWKPLTPLTNDPKEWMDVGYDMWQSTRSPSSFSEDGGKTHYNLDDDPKIIYITKEKVKNEAL